MDDTPLWNDAKEMPYTFSDLPDLLKLPHYRQGVDAVEADNPYAAILCSAHYASFFDPPGSPHEASFYQHERARQARLMRELGVDEAELAAHLRVLQFLDRLSIYICMTEPDMPPGTGWTAFRDGFPDSEHLPGTGGGRRIAARWLDNAHMGLGPFPFRGPVEAVLPVRVIGRARIRAEGLVAAYRTTPVTPRSLTLVPIT